MNVRPPYGYPPIVPLGRHHRVRLPGERELPEPFRHMNPMPVSVSEFGAAGRDYPLMFVSGDSGSTFLPMAVLGLVPGENLFVLWDGSWDRRAYVPAYVRRYPFCAAQVSVDGQPRAERLACVVETALDGSGEALFDETGAPLPAWDARQRFLFEYEADLERTRRMCDLLAGLGLLESFTMEATPSDAAPQVLTGMYRVSEPRLAELESGRLRDLVIDGVLARVYQHLSSLGRFGALLQRSAAMRRRSCDS